MNFKNNYHYLIVLFLFLIVTFSLVYYLGLDRHWVTSYDHEFTLTYNALLFNNGKSIEYIQHPGFFSILLLSLSFKLLSLLNFIAVDKLSLLNNDNFEQSFQILIFYTRIYSTVCVAAFCTASYALFYKFSKLKVYSCILSLLLFSTFGTIFHIAQLRTELIAMGFVILSLISLKTFFEEDKRYKLFYISCFFLFSFCALLNKMQVFFFIPFFFLIFYFCENKIEDFDTKEYNFLSKNLTSFILFFIIIFYLYIENNTQHPFPILSTAAVLFNLLVMNFFFYLILKNNSKKIKINLAVINLTFILVFFLLKNFLSIHPSASPSIFAHLTRIMDLGMYISSAPDIQNTPVFIAALFQKFWVNFLTVLNNHAFKLNTYIVIIVLNLIITIIYRKLLNPKIIKFNIACLCSVIFILIINSYRAGGTILSFYYIFTDLFIVLSLCGFYKVLKYRYLSIIFIFIIYINFQTNLEYLNSKKITDQKNVAIKINNVCQSSYFYDWHKQINKEYFITFCKKYSQ